MHDLIPLPHLVAGQTATVDIVMGQGDHVHRLHELGLRAGAVVEMVQTGSGCIIRLGSQKLCLRCEELTTVLVRRATN